jgi:hypothetical protein
VARGVQSLAGAETREAWQQGHRSGLLLDAQTYDDLADALEADLARRQVEGDRPWSAKRRAKKRVKPLRKTAKSMRRAARSISSTVAAYEETAPEQVAKAREAKARERAQRRGQALTAAQEVTARAAQRQPEPEEARESRDLSIAELLRQHRGA